VVSTGIARVFRCFPLHEGKVCRAPFFVHNAISRKANASAIGIAAIARGSTGFDCAWTANTTVRIAGKPVKSVWFNPMTDEPVRTVFHLDKDSRLVSVFCSAVEYQAEHAGLEGGAGAQLALAAGDVCREAISQGSGGDSGIDVTLDTFHDRMEVAIHYRGQGLPTDGSGNASAGAKFKGADRVHCKADEGIARVTLVKFLTGHR
jgi:hypothetical protein